MERFPALLHEQCSDPPAWMFLMLLINARLKMLLGSFLHIHNRSGGDSLIVPCGYWKPVPVLLWFGVCLPPEALRSGYSKLLVMPSRERECP